MKPFTLGFILGALFATVVNTCHASATPVREQSIVSVGTDFCVDVTTSAWVAFPTTALTGRVGLYATVIATAAANMGAKFGTTTPAATEVAEKAPIILKPGLTQFHSPATGVIFYIRSANRGVGAETACGQEVKQ